MGKKKAGVFGNCTECGDRLGVHDDSMCVDCEVELRKRQPAPIMAVSQLSEDRIAALKKEWQAAYESRHIAVFSDDPLASKSIWSIAATRFVMWLRRIGLK